MSVLSTAEIVQNVIVNNQGLDVGGIKSSSFDGSIVANTIVGNQDYANGGGSELELLAIGSSDRLKSQTT